MKEIKCPYDLNQFLLGEPIFENPFPEEECEQRKFYGDCYHCFSTAISSRDHQLKASITEQKTARWLRVDRGGVEYTGECSNCGRGTFWHMAICFNYCPNCGAKMEVEDNG